jgi:hypothetical protein
MEANRAVVQAEAAVEADVAAAAAGLLALRPRVKLSYPLMMMEVWK